MYIKIRVVAIIFSNRRLIFCRGYVFRIIDLIIANPFLKCFKRLHGCGVRRAGAEYDVNTAETLRRLMLQEERYSNIRTYIICIE